MQTTQFEEIEAEFLARVAAVVYCTFATVDRRNRPRLRLMHPIWEGSTGWVISWPQSHKARHLEHNPAVSLAYMPAPATPVYVDGSATWIDDRAEMQRVWELHRDTLPPLGFDPEPHYGSIDHHYFGLLRIVPWRIELGNLYGEPLIWRDSATQRAVP